jgi:CheY-like chemotaxis protein
MSFDVSYFILVAEDNLDHVKILERALAQADTPVNFEVVPTGEGVISYLRGEGEYADRRRHPIPHLILLDLKMPGMSGFDVLTWIRQRAEWRCIPVIVLTVSHYGPDIQKAYELGANSFLSKDSNFDNFCASLRQMADFWLKHAILPQPGPFVPDPATQRSEAKATVPPGLRGSARTNRLENEISDEQRNVGSRSGLTSQRSEPEPND